MADIHEEHFDFWDRSPANFSRRLGFIMDTMRLISVQTDPQEMVRAYWTRMADVVSGEGYVGISHRELEWPKYRITRSHLYDGNMNPWVNRDKLQVFESGLMGELIYSNEARIIDDLQIAPNDPAKKFYEGYQSLMAVPLFDGGEALNMVCFLRREKKGFHAERLPEQVWMANLFGRATSNLVLKDQLEKAYKQIDNELKVVADIQQSLLPRQLPHIRTLDLAAHYQTSRHAGGDYYDFFPLPDGLWGMLIADVSGHGTPAAVLMAVTHSIAHTHDGAPTPPSVLMQFLNRHLAKRYTGNGTFVTAFYGIYDPSKRSITYCCAGHPPPRIKRCSTGELLCLDGVGSLPLGIMEDEEFEDATTTLVPGDFVVFYTDGITEAKSREGELFGSQRLDTIVATCPMSAQALIGSVLDGVSEFTSAAPADDDRTLLIARVT